MTKLCYKCRIPKDTSEFAKSSKNKDGFQSYCNACKSVIDKERYQTHRSTIDASNNKNRRKSMLYLCSVLAAAHCEMCQTTNPMVLTFDHVRGEKLMEVSTMVKSGWGIPAIQAEMAKCRVLCFNCHMIDENRKRNTLKWQYFNGESIQIN